MDFNYQSERFADLQLLRYRLNGFENLSLRQKKLVYFLAKATLYGRDITFDQYGRYNLLIRKVLEVVYTDSKIIRDTDEFRAFETYLKRVWFSNGIYHHYGCDKFEPSFSPEFLLEAILMVDDMRRLPFAEKEGVMSLWETIREIIFDKDLLPKRVNKEDGQDLVATSACNFYHNVTQNEAEAFYNRKKSENADSKTPQSYGLNSTLIKEDGIVKEHIWYADGVYGNAIRHIVYWLEKAQEVAENDQQKKIISLLVRYYKTGDLDVFNEYCIE